MRFGNARGSAVTAATVAALSLIPSVGDAVLPFVAGLGKQIVQNMLLDTVKGQLIGSLSQMGCKGATIAGLIGQAGAGNRGGLPGGSLGGALSPGAPGGGALPPGLPGGSPMPGGVPMPGGANATLGEGRALRAARGADNILTLPPGVDPRSLDMAQILALAEQQMGSRMPASDRMSPEQLRQAQAALSNMQQAMSQPLSREETLGVFDELAQMGVLTPAMQSEARDCIRLAPPAASANLGASGAMLKSVVLPQLRTVRQSLSELDPDQQQQLAEEIIDALDTASPQDRKAFEEGFGLGFFPPSVVEAVQAGLH